MSRWVFYEKHKLLILHELLDSLSDCFWWGPCCSFIFWFNLWTVMRAGGLAPYNLIQPTISFEMSVPSQGHYVFTVFRLLTDFICLYNYEFWLSLCKIVRSSVILLLPLFSCLWYVLCFVCICSVFCTQFAYFSGFSILIDPSVFYNVYFEIQQNNSLITVSLCQAFRCEASDIIWIVSECVIAI